MRQRGVDSIICLGDLVGYGPSPNETLDLIRAEGIMCCLGAADERIAFDFARARKPLNGVADQILEWTREVIEPRQVEFLRTLPVQRRLNTPAGRLRFFHGSPDTPGALLNVNPVPSSLAQLVRRPGCALSA